MKKDFFSFVDTYDEFEQRGQYLKNCQPLYSKTKSSNVWVIIEGLLRTFAFGLLCVGGFAVLVYCLLIRYQVVPNDLELRGLNLNLISCLGIVCCGMFMFPAWLSFWGLKKTYSKIGTHAYYADKINQGFGNYRLCEILGEKEGLAQIIPLNAPPGEIWTVSKEDLFTGVLCSKDTF